MEWPPVACVCAPLDFDDGSRFSLSGYYTGKGALCVVPLNDLRHSIHDEVNYQNKVLDLMTNYY